MDQDGQGSLSGRRVAVMETRRGDEMQALLEREGADVIRAPSLRELKEDDLSDLRQAIGTIERDGVDVAVFQTGVGVLALFELAGRLGLEAELTARLRQAAIVARGPKPLAALHQQGFEVALKTVEPHTTTETMAALQQVDLDGRHVAVQHYGAVNSALVEWLRGRGAQVIDLVTYHWGLPEDLGPVRRFLDELAGGRLDFVAFTSASQVYNLFVVAGPEQAGELAGWLNDRTVVASIGPACTRALSAHGIAPGIQPERPKMVPLVQAIAAAG